MSAEFIRRSSVNTRENCSKTIVNKGHHEDKGTYKGQGEVKLV